MASSKKPTHVVEHKRLYLAVKGKLQHIPQGTQLTLTSKQAEKLKTRVKPLGDEEAVDLTADDALTVLRARAAELNLEGASKWGEKRLKEEISKAEAAIEEANAAVE